MVDPKQSAEVSYIMSKALKTQEPVMFLGNEIILKSINYTDDLIIKSIVQDVYAAASAAGIDGPMLERLLMTTQVLAHVKMVAYNKDGSPLYKTMEDLNAVIKDVKVFQAVNELFVQYMQLLDLSMAEKKSSS